MQRPIHPVESYSIGIICALGIEKAAVDAVLDEEHGSPKKAAGDDNSYAFGKIGEHNVVTACLPAGVMGKVSATAVAKDMMRSFPIKAGFMVGVGGGVWSEQNDVRLGDVVVSEPHGVHGGVVQWDFGKMQKEGVFERTGTLNKPPRPLLSAMQNLKAVHERKDSEVAEHLMQMLHNNPKMRKNFDHPGRHHDGLFEASYQHSSGDDCTGCDRSKLLQHRPDRDNDTPQIHYGNIASGDEVMKDGPTRDRIAREEEILCFEMEAAGLMDTFPCVVIRGVCDYADSHKNKQWQRYAAATAACYCKELLGMVDHQGIAELSQAKLSARPDKVESTRSAHHGSGDINNYSGLGNQENHRYKISGGSGNIYNIRGDMHNHPPQEHPETPPEPSSNVPFHRDPQFIERVDLTDQIRAKLAVPAGRAALVGLGGVGKTQLAIEYARQLRQQSPQTWVLWLHASNPARFHQSLVDVANQLKIYGEKEADLLLQIQRWLRHNSKGKWLIILDNADDADFLLEPPATSSEAEPMQRRINYFNSEHGSMMITTRSKIEALKLFHESKAIVVGPMSEDEAEALLEDKLRHASTDNRRLAVALDCMPLAITQAAAYISKMGLMCSVKQYHELMERSRTSRTSLLRREVSMPDRDREASSSVLLTWQISFEHILGFKKSAADLLSLMSFCDRLAIPETLLRAGIKETAVDSSYFDFLEDIATLRSFSFISDTRSAGSWEMHRLVQDAMHTWLLDRKDFSTVLNQFVHHLCICLPTGRHENWPVCHILFPHAKAAAEYKPTNTETLQEWATAMFKSAWYASEQGNLPDALLMATASMEVRSEELGEEHVLTLSSETMVADTYRNQGRWKDAEELEVKVMEIRRTVLGAEHPDALTSMANLASTYWNQGRWKEAEELEVKVVEIRRAVLGAEHPETLTSIGNLASTYRNQGRWKEAEELEVKVMEISRTVLGAEHPSTLTSIANLASTYWNQGRWKEAEELEVKVMEIRRAVLGAEHPSTLTSMNNLASTYWNQGRWKEAEELFMMVMEIRRTVLGAEHPDTLTSIANLASTYQNQGRWKDAEELEVKVMEIRRTVLGAEHPDALTSMANLASTYRNQGRWKEAEELEVKVMEIRRTVLGAEHPSALMSMNNLASTYRNQGRWKEAEELEVKVMEIRRTVLGAEHPSTLTSMANLASTYWNQGRWKEAEELEVKVMEIRRTVLGAEHPSTLTSMANLAFTLRGLGRYQDALSLISTCADRSLAVLGVEHSDRKGYGLVKTRWEKEDSLRAGEEAVRIISGKSADGGRRATQFPSYLSTMFFILAGFAVVLAVVFRQHIV